MDGDTVHVSIDDTDVTLRVLGVSAPETRKRRDCGGPEATALMARLAPSGTKVTVSTDSATGDIVDAYGRTLGFADVRGRDIGEQIIRAAARPSTATAAGASRASTATRPSNATPARRGAGRERHAPASTSLNAPRAPGILTHIAHRLAPHLRR